MQQKAEAEKLLLNRVGKPKTYIMNLEKFEAEKLRNEEMHPLVGGALGQATKDTPTNCGTAWTRSEGADSDVDNEGDEWATDQDKDIYVKVRVKKVKVALP